MLHITHVKCYLKFEKIQHGAICIVYYLNKFHVVIDKLVVFVLAAVLLRVFRKTFDVREFLSDILSEEGHHGLALISIISDVTEIHDESEQ